MRRRLSTLFILLAFIPLLFVNTRASSETIDDYICQANMDLSIYKSYEFNYIFINEKKLNNISERMANYPSKNNTADGDYSIFISIGNDMNLEIYYSVNNGRGIYLYAAIEDDVFLLITENSIESTSLDLRKYDCVFKMNFANFKANGMNLDAFYAFMENVGFDYISTVLIKEIKYDDVYYIDNAKTLEELSDIYYSKEQYSFRIGNYSKEVGSHEFYVCILDTTAVLYIHHYKIRIYDSSSILCDSINVSYKDPITMNYYRNNHVHGYNMDFNKNEYRLFSDYFYNNSSKLGDYPVTFYYKNEEIEFEASGVISVVDDIPPTINGKSIINDKLSERIDIFELLKTYTAWDEIDGDLTEKIKISNLDNYTNEVDRGGTFRFLIECEDNSGNKAKRTIKYVLEDDIHHDEPQPITEPAINEENNNITTTTSTTETPSNQIIIEYTLKANINNPLSMEDLRRKLIFYGLIDEDYDGEIITDYFGNEAINGEYQILVDNNGKHYYSLVVEGTKDININNQETNSNNLVLIIVLSSVGGLALIAIIVMVIIIIKKKLNK